MSQKPGPTTFLTPGRTNSPQIPESAPTIIADCKTMQPGKKQHPATSNSKTPTGMTWATRDENKTQPSQPRARTAHVSQKRSRMLASGHGTRPRTGAAPGAGFQIRSAEVPVRSLSLIASGKEASRSGITAAQRAAHHGNGAQTERSRNVGVGIPPRTAHGSSRTSKNSLHEDSCTHRPMTTHFAANAPRQRIWTSSHAMKPLQLACSNQSANTSDAHSSWQIKNSVTNKEGSSTKTQKKKGNQKYAEVQSRVSGMFNKNTQKGGGIDVLAGPVELAQQRRKKFTGQNYAANELTTDASRMAARLDTFIGRRRPRPQRASVIPPPSTVVQKIEDRIARKAAFTSVLNDNDVKEQLDKPAEDDDLNINKRIMDLFDKEEPRTHLQSFLPATGSPKRTSGIAKLQKAARAVTAFHVGKPKHAGARRVHTAGTAQDGSFKIASSVGRDRLKADDQDNDFQESSKKFVLPSEKLGYEGDTRLQAAKDPFIEQIAAACQAWDPVIAVSDLSKTFRQSAPRVEQRSIDYNWQAHPSATGVPRKDYEEKRGEFERLQAPSPPPDETDGMLSLEQARGKFDATPPLPTPPASPDMGPEMMETALGENNRNIMLDTIRCRLVTATSREAVADTRKKVKEYMKKREQEQEKMHAREIAGSQSNRQRMKSRTRSSRTLGEDADETVENNHDNNQDESITSKEKDSTNMDPELDNPLERYIQECEARVLIPRPGLFDHRSITTEQKQLVLGLVEKDAANHRLNAKALKDQMGENGSSDIPVANYYSDSDDEDNIRARQEEKYHAPQPDIHFEPWKLSNPVKDGDLRRPINRKLGEEILKLLDTAGKEAIKQAGRIKRGQEPNHITPKSNHSDDQKDPVSNNGSNEGYKQAINDKTSQVSDEDVLLLQGLPPQSPLSANSASPLAAPVHLVQTPRPHLQSEFGHLQELQRQKTATEVIEGAGFQSQEDEYHDQDGADYQEDDEDWTDWSSFGGKPGAAAASSPSQMQQLTPTSENSQTLARSSSGLQGLMKMRAMHSSTTELLNHGMDSNSRTSSQAKMSRVPSQSGLSQSGADAMSVEGQSINIPHQALGNDGAKAAAASLWAGTDLLRLNFAHNAIGHKGGRPVLRAIVQSHPCRTLQSINLSHNPLGRDLQEFLEPLAMLPNLASLDMSSTGICDAGVIELCKGVAESKSLVDLHLKECMIEHQGAQALAEAVGFCDSLRVLNLRWNRIRHEGAKSIVSMLRSNQGLQNVDLSWNGFGGDETTGDDWGFVIEENETLRELNISHNRLSERNCFVIGECLQNNTALQCLDLSGSIAGETGGSSLSRIADEWGNERLLLLNDVNMSVHDPDCFSPESPDGQYCLDLKRIYDNVVARVACRVACKSGSEFKSIRNERFNGFKTMIPEDGTFQVPTYGILEFTFARGGTIQSGPYTGFDIIKPLAATKQQPLAQRKAAAGFEHHRGVEGFMDVIDASKAAMDHIARSDGQPRAEEAVHVLDIYGVQVPWHCVLNSLEGISEDAELCSGKEKPPLSSAGKDQLQRTLAMLFYFCPNNPTGHYLFNLSNDIERRMLADLLEIASHERAARKSLSLKDTSQHQNASMFRNEEYNERQIEMGADFLPPATGHIHFDFVSTTRPDADAQVITQQSLETLVELCSDEGISENARIIVLRWRLSNFNLDVTAAIKLVSQFCQPEARVEAVVACYGRLVNNKPYLHNLYPLLSKDEFFTVIRRLGILNVWNPIHSDIAYCLNLELWDERCVVAMLMEMAMSEPGENWIDETFNGVGFELPQKWFKVMPKRGVLMLKYVTQKGKEDRRLRNTWLQRTGCYRTTLPQKHMFLVSLLQRYNDDKSIVIQRLLDAADDSGPTSYDGVFDWTQILSVDTGYGDEDGRTDGSSARSRPSTRNSAAAGASLLSSRPSKGMGSQRQQLHVETASATSLRTPRPPSTEKASTVNSASGLSALRSRQSMSSRGHL